MKCFLIVFMSLSCCFFATEQTSVPQGNLSFKPEVFTLSNGLTVIIEDNPILPVASVQAWVATGSIHEGKWLGGGLSHILEHMLFKGTTNRTGTEISNQIQDEGGYINAYTSFDRTVYWIDTPSKGVHQAVDILADVMMNATLPPDEYIKEQEVIRREFAMNNDNPDRMATLLLFRGMFHVSSFKEPVIGQMDIYNKLTREDVMEYYKKRYVPNNICFVVVGDVNKEAILNHLKKIFEKYPARSLEPVFVPKEPPQLGYHEIRDNFPTDLSRINIAWHAPGCNNKEAPAIEVLSAILGLGNSSILNCEIHEKQKLVHHISAGFYSLTPTEGIIYVDAIADPDKRELVEKAIQDQVNLLLSQGVTEDQMNKVKKMLLTDHYNNLDTVRGRASDYGNGWIMSGNPEAGKNYLKAIENVSVEKINKVAHKYLTTDTLTVSSLDPQNNMSKKDEQKNILSVPSTSMEKLSNGLRVLIREDNRLPLVSINMIFRGGLCAETPKKNGLSQLFASTIIKGTDSKTAEQIMESIENVGGSMSSSSGNNTFSISLEVMKNDIELALELLSDTILHPKFSEDEIEKEKNSQIAAIKAQSDQITTVAKNLFNEKLYAHHPYGLPLLGTLSSISGLNREDLKEYHSNFVVGNNAILSIFGDVNKQEVMPLVQKYFLTLPSGQIALSHPPEVLPLQHTVEFSQSLPKQQAVVMIGFLGTTLNNSDRATLEVIESASNDLGSRFFNAIREKMSLAYFVGASQSIGLSKGSFVFYLGTDPKKSGIAEAELETQIKLLVTEGLSEKELQRAKIKLLGSKLIHNQSNTILGTISANNEIMGLGFGFERKNQTDIENVSREDVLNVLKKYFQFSHAVKIIVSPNIVTNEPDTVKKS